MPPCPGCGYETDADDPCPTCEADAWAASETPEEEEITVKETPPLPRHIVDQVLRDVETWLCMRRAHSPYPGKYGSYADPALALYAALTGALTRANAT